MATANPRPAPIHSRMQNLVDDIWQAIDGGADESKSHCAITLYIRDLNTESYRLVAWKGVRDTSRMFAPVPPNTTAYGHISSRPTENPGTYRVPSRNPLDFVARESIKLHTRLVLPLTADSAPPIISVFLNWRDEKLIPFKIHQQLRMLVGTLEHYWSTPGSGTVERTQAELAALRRIIPAMAQLASEGGREQLHKEILDLALGLCDATTRDSARASLHLYDPAAAKLTVIARSPADGASESTDQSPQARPLDEGITGIVARDRQTILIEDLEHSTLKSRFIATQHAQPARSCLAVPLVGACDSLVGVLNLEHRHPCAFNPSHVWTLCHFSHIAAVALQMREMQTAITECGAAVASVLSERPVEAIARQDVAPAAKKLMSANYAEFWVQAGDVWVGGGTEGVTEQWKPRNQGLTGLMLRRQQPILVSEIKTVKEFVLEDVIRTNQNGVIYEPVSKDEYRGLSLNRTAVEIGQVKAIIGIPIGSPPRGAIFVKFKELATVNKIALVQFLNFAEQIGMGFGSRLMGDAVRSGRLSFYGADDVVAGLDSVTPKRRTLLGLQVDFPRTGQAQWIEDVSHKMQVAIRDTQGGIYIGVHGSALLGFLDVTGIDATEILERLEGFQSRIGGRCHSISTAIGEGTIQVVLLHRGTDCYVDGEVMRRLRSAPVEPKVNWRYHKSVKAHFDSSRPESLFEPIGKPGSDWFALNPAS